MQIPTKLRAKCRVLWKTIAIREKRDNIKKHLYLRKETQQTPICKNLSNPWENKKKQTKKRVEYFQSQINKIKNVVEDGKSRLA